MSEPERNHGDHTDDSDEWERIESTMNQTPGKWVSINKTAEKSGRLAYFSAGARDAMGRPEYLSFYKTGSKVGVEPVNEQSGVNPHSLSEEGCASIQWHPSEATGYAALEWDDRREFWVFDMAELYDSAEAALQHADD